ncbi:MAG: hypothetical protein ACAI25_10150 [Planctomycetota bacterium]
MNLYFHDRRFVTDFEVSDLTDDGEYRVSAAYTYLKLKGGDSETTEDAIPEV